MAGYFIKKNLQQLIAEAGDPNLREGHGSNAPGQAAGAGDEKPALHRTLGAFNLTMLGIGAVIGAGIFSLSGQAAAADAGPGVVYSFIIGGILCTLAGLCYAEMAAMVPVAGSAYAYSYATMGELIAWIIGWDLILEYAFGAVTVSVSWSGYLFSLAHKTLGIEFPDVLTRLTKGPFESVTLHDGSEGAGLWNAPATFIAIFMTLVLYRGMRESAFVNNIIVVTKVIIVIVFILLGWSVVSHSNWVADPGAGTFASLIPPRGPAVAGGKDTYGWLGVVAGAGTVFFAYIGFDAVTTTAQECKNPKRDLPIGILASLAICTVLYILVALVMTGVVPYAKLGVPDPVAVGIDRITELRGWSSGTKTIFTFAVKVGALAGLTSVILVMMIGQTRVFFAMAHDGLLPWFNRIHPRYGTPTTATIVTGVFVAFCGGLIPLRVVGHLVSIGTLLAFVLVCIGIPILRVTSPDIPRPFRTPAAWFVAPAGAIACFCVMLGLDHETWLRLVVWLVIGFVVYFTYGVRHSRLRRAAAGAAPAGPSVGAE